VLQHTIHSVSERDDSAPAWSLRSTAGAERGRCLLCGGCLELTLSDVTDNRLGTPGSFEIRRCAECGFEQTYPLPTQAELTQLYTTYYNFGGERDSLYTKLREWFLFSIANRLWIRLDGDVAFHGRRGTGRLLDIGCNEGRGLRIHASNGFKAEGLELNEAAAAVARDAGFEVQTRLLEDFSPKEPFDVAVLSNVLEHSLEPRRMLLDVHRILKPGGQVWVSCPNSQSWLRKAFGRAWINWHVPFHISHFSDETLRHLLQQSGFSAIEIRQISPAHWAAASFIARVFARKGRATRSMRNPVLVLVLVAIARFAFFPVLWFGNMIRRGDCLLVTARKTEELKANG
jgi:2-polyprenyl-3-methyl-5-hydroxy-6-metoxy-1,4-benzoquinol methylase